MKILENSKNKISEDFDNEKTKASNKLKDWPNTIEKSNNIWLIKAK